MAIMIHRSNNGGLSFGDEAPAASTLVPTWTLESRLLQFIPAPLYASGSRDAIN